MSVYTFILAGALTIQFSSDQPIDITPNQLQNFAARLPGFVTSQSTTRPVDITIEHHEDSDFSYKQRPNQIIWHEKWSGKLSPDFVHVFYGAARHAWLEKGLFPVHAACVGTPDQGYVLLIGRAGSGKTSISLAAKQTYKYDLISGDTTLIQSDGTTLNVVGGTKVLTIRTQDRFRWPAFDKQFVQLGDRLILTLDDTKFKECHIKGIAVVQLNDHNDSFAKLNPLSALHTAYPYFIDFERSDVLLDGGQDLLNGDIDPDLKRLIVQKLSPAVKQTPTYILTGSMPYVLDRIKDILAA